MAKTSPITKKIFKWAGLFLFGFLIFVSIASSLNAQVARYFLGGLLTYPGTLTDHYAWGENVGWIDFSTASVTDTALTGYAYGENIGWISLNCANDGTNCNPSYKVENDGAGNLSGYAWGENVGWINFDPVYDGTHYGVKINTTTGLFSGWAWGENIGWIAFTDLGPLANISPNFVVTTSWRPSVDCSTLMDHCETCTAENVCTACTSPYSVKTDRTGCEILVVDNGGGDNNQETPATNTGGSTQTAASSFFLITASPDDGGYIKPFGSTLVSPGGSVKYTIFPASGHKIQDVLIDGVSKGPLLTYTFENVTGNHTISAVFAAGIAPANQNIPTTAPTQPITPNIGSGSSKQDILTYIQSQLNNIKIRIPSSSPTHPIQPTTPPGLLTPGAPPPSQTPSSNVNQMVQVIQKMISALLQLLHIAQTK